MTSKRSVVLAALIVFVVGVLAATGQDLTPSTSQDCSTLVLGMADCLTFVTSGSTVYKPEGQCCPGLKSVLRTDAQCLCDAFKNSASFGVQLNMTKALSLPAACDVSAPSAKTCGLSLTPAGAPAGAVGSPTTTEGPDSSIANTPTSASSPSNLGASEMSPSPAQGANGSSSSQMITFFSLGLTVAALAAASSIILSNSY